MKTYEELYNIFSWESFSRENLDWSPKERLNITHEAVDRHAKDPHKVAMFCIRQGGQCEKITYRELQRFTNRFANLLRGLGIGRGDRVARLLPRIPESYFAFLGTWKAGAVDVPLYTAFGPEAIAYRVKDSGVKLIVTDAENRKKLTSIKDIEGVNILVVSSGKGVGLHKGDQSFWHEMDQASDRFDTVSCRQNENAVILYTSGTTGSPKGTMIPMSGIITVLPFARFNLDIQPHDMFWGFADPGWAYGLLTAGASSLVLGNSLIVYEPGFTAEGWYETIARYEVTNFTAAPTAFRLIMAAGEDLTKKYDHSSLRRLSSAGEALNPEVAVWFKRHFGIDLFDMYGMTEVGMLIANNPYNSVKLGSMGKPIFGFQIALVNDMGEPVPKGKVGIISCHRENPYFLCHGYLNNPEKWEAAFLKGCWFNTGDLARQDEDGYYYFEGRNDDVISSAAYRIGPAEVENVLIEHPAVAESAVVGKPDKLRGEVVKAFVVLKPNYQPSDSLKEEIQLFVKNRLAKHSYPREIEFVNDLPKTPSGKIMRKVLREKEYERARENEPVFKGK
jgi:acetyl-CoA synthetase